MLMGHLKTLIRLLTPNPLKVILKKLPKDAAICFFWNRGLGDIPLEIYPFIYTLKKALPAAKITVITRDDLVNGFKLLPFDLELYSSDLLVRKQKEHHGDILKSLNLDVFSFDYIFTSPDTNYWLKKEKQGMPIFLNLPEQQDMFPLKSSTKPLALLHIDSETTYGFEKNLSVEFWHKLISNLHLRGYDTVALGHKQKGHLDVSYDLRSKTTLFEVIDLVKSPNALFIGPDSGLLNILYYLKDPIPMRLISYWANTNVGLMRQKTLSLNPKLIHHALIAKEGDLKHLEVADFLQFIPDMSFLKSIYLNDPLEDSFPSKDLVLNALEKLQSLKLKKQLRWDHIQDPLCKDFENTLDYDKQIIPIILAGGQGTRLGASQPKALFKVAGKTLLEHFIDKIHHASAACNTKLKAIMIVSSEGYRPILHYLQDNSYFGLDKDSLHLIVQNNLPFMTDKGQLVLKDSSTLYEGPGGNGEVFHLLKDNNLLLDCVGFEIIPIDNPLAPLYSTHHARCFREGSDVSVIAIELDSYHQNLGRLGLCDHTIRIIEYSENPPEHLQLGNTGLLGFSFEFAKHLSQKPLPDVHVALKNYDCFTGKTYEKLKVKKFETFIFDHLERTTKIQILKAQAKDVFQPLKEKHGPYGIEALENALSSCSFSDMVGKKGAL